MSFGSQPGLGAGSPRWGRRSAVAGLRGASAAGLESVKVECPAAFQTQPVGSANHA